jgi:hypothetical protein
MLAVSFLGSHFAKASLLFISENLDHSVRRNQASIINLEVRGVTSLAVWYDGGQRALQACA